MALLEKIVVAAGFRAPERPAAARPAPVASTVFVGHGRWLLADDLGSSDPFRLLPGQIVDRVLSTHRQASLDAPGRHSVHASAKGEAVERDGRRFLVWRDPKAETIAVMEIGNPACGCDAAGRAGDPG